MRDGQKILLETSHQILTAFLTAMVMVGAFELTREMETAREVTIFHLHVENEGPPLVDVSAPWLSGGYAGS